MRDDHTQRSAARRQKVKNVLNAPPEPALPIWLRVVLLIVFGIPVIVCVLAWLFGSILAVCEGGSAYNGFLYVIGNLCGLATPLTNVSPDSTLGTIVDILVAIWSLSVAGTIIGLIGSFAVINDFGGNMEGTKQETDHDSMKQSLAMDAIIKQFHEKDHSVDLELAKLRESVELELAKLRDAINKHIALAPRIE